MLFHSAQFGVFFITVFCLFWLLHRWRVPRMVFLLAASCAFYMSWNPYFILLILFSASVDYVVALQLEHVTTLWKRRLMLALSISINLSLLFFFKYTYLLASTIHTGLDAIGISLPPLVGESPGSAGASFKILGEYWGMGADSVLLKVVLPLGISFYTFETISYIVDVYQGKIKPVRSLLDYALYIMFFPHLVAGPIVRPGDFLPQLKDAPQYETDRVKSGMLLIFVGLLKKVLIADVLAETLVDEAYAHPDQASGWHLLLATYGYAFQIYGDFSGYSDIAIGAARMLGFELPINFNSPYQATSIRDFWRRWHISLSIWLRDYLYIPLGGNRGNIWRTNFNLFMTLVIAGLWHGAAWNFVLFGVYHGILLCGESLWRAWRYGSSKVEITLNRWQTMLAIVVTFQVLCIGLVIFRSQSLAHIGVIYSRILSWAPAAHSEIYPHERGMWILLLAIAAHYWPRTWSVAAVHWLDRMPAPLQGGLAVVGLGAIGIVLSANHPFVYFQF
jgi:D-alanyl-lipoteichoic acid acyltransferase DltB (MBOAT superfamily)